MEKKIFQAESKRLLDLVIHSIYTNKEIFLREIISNASDAIDKVHYKALTDDSISFKKEDYYIRITPNKEARTLTITDTGIGMTKEELEENLGTIAKSGSFDIKSTQEIDKDFDIIGQFGVGFYSVFMVSDKVEVITRSITDDKAYRWTSEGADGYTIEETDRSSHGTDIILYLRADTEDDHFSDYLDEARLRHLIRHYSDYIRYPILMLTEKSRPIPSTEDSTDLEYESYFEDDTLNSMTPIWRRNKNDLTDEDYTNFYHDRHFGFDQPLAHIHMNADGTISYKAILYIPGEPPFDYYSKDYKGGLSLYANGVLIMDRCEELLPDYYSFVKGVIDSEDLSLNISREMLQQDRQLQLIKRHIDDRISKELKNLLEKDREKYNAFFKAFGDQIKINIYENFGQYKEKLQDYLLFYSSKQAKFITLKEYVDAMPEDQSFIYYASGDSINKIDHLPQVNIIKNHNYDVLYFTKNLDEFVIKTLRSYQEKIFRSASESDLGLDQNNPDTDNETQVDNSAYSELLSKIKTILGEKVSRVATTKDLKDDLAYLSTDGDISIEMELLLNALPNSDGMLKAQKVLTLNENHPVFQKLLSLFQEGQEDLLTNYSNLIYDQSCLIADIPLEDPAAFAKSLSKLMI